MLNRKQQDRELLVSMKYGGTFSNEHLAVCPAKDTACTSCKYKGHFTRLCKNVNIVNTQIVDTADYNPSGYLNVNSDHLKRKCFCVVKCMVGICTE